jgi:hypothetical protein
MTTRTRRRLTLCLAIALIALPAEALLFPVALTPDPVVAAADWAESLSPDALHAAAADIERYPPHYRRAIMGELPPEHRSDVWRAHFTKYVQARPQLTPEQIAVVQDAIAVAAPEAFASPVPADTRARITAIYQQAVKVLGAKEANELFVTLGPKTLQASALPFRQRVGDHLRSWRTASAQVPDCNCNIDIDTCDVVPNPWLQCSELYTCIFDLTWPMCGPLWAWACTGWCKIIRWPDGTLQ